MNLIRLLASLPLDLVFITTRHASLTDSTRPNLVACRCSSSSRLALFFLSPDCCVSDHSAHSTHPAHSHEFASFVVRDQLSPLYTLVHHDLFPPPLLPSWLLFPLLRFVTRPSPHNPRIASPLQSPCSTLHSDTPTQRRATQYIHLSPTLPFSCPPPPPFVLIL